MDMKKFTSEVAEKGNKSLTKKKKEEEGSYIEKSRWNKNTKKEQIS